MADTTGSMTARIAAGGGAAINAFARAGTQFADTDSLDQQVLNTTLGAVSDVLRDVGLPLDTLAGVESVSRLRKNGLMGVNGFNVLSIERGSFSDKETAAVTTSRDKRPDNFTAYGIRGVATHEAGHLVMNALTRKEYTGKSNLDRANARKKGTVDKQVIKEASKRYGSNPRISRYGSTSFSEKVAEAFSDVYTNKSNAQAYSQVIVDVVKERLR